MSIVPEMYCSKKSNWDSEGLEKCFAWILFSPGVREPSLLWAREKSANSKSTSWEEWEIKEQTLDTKIINNSTRLSLQNPLYPHGRLTSLVLHFWGSSSVALDWFKVTSCVQYKFVEWHFNIVSALSSLLENSFVRKVMKQSKEHIHQITDTYDLDKEKIIFFLKKTSTSGYILWLGKGTYHPMLLKIARKIYALIL